MACVLVDITCRHGSISTSLHEHTVEKSEKLLTFFERITSIQVTYDFEGDRVKVEMLVDSEHKHNFVAHASGEDAYTTFDSTVHKMEKQIHKYKEKIQDHRRDIPLKSLSEVEQADSETSSEEE